MRISISHTNQFRYARPAKGVIQTIRMTPRNHAAQHVARWRVEIDADARLRQGEDAFGNVAHTLDATGPIEGLSIHVEGEVETRDAAGVVSGATERFPAEFFFRSTDLTALTPEMADYAQEARRACGEQRDFLNVMHGLMSALHRDIALNLDPAEAGGKAVDAFQARRGAGADHAHIFCAMARHLGVPARFVSGYFRRSDDKAGDAAGHAWAEVNIGGLGWVGFDAANNVCATEAHVRVAAALDQLGAAPVRGSHIGGSEETLSVVIKIMQLQMQS
ncbi:MAG: transglutaminase family protein [Beijerinckiaceae bacterium]